jgi:anti-sigma regulatory factor (Ser/Thr protein kinase)
MDDEHRPTSDLHVRLMPDLRTLGPIRRLLAARFSFLLDEAQLSDVVLIVNELVANAMIHGGRPDTLDVISRDGLVEIAVSDRNGGEPRIGPPHATGGRGLSIVDVLTQSWGVRREGDRKTVWAHLGARSNEAAA